MEEDYDQDIPLIEWAVISGVPEQELNHSRLREFFSWLIPQLNAHSIASNKNGVFFAPAPRTTIIVRRKGKGGDVSASGDRRRKNEIEEKTEAAESESVSVKDRTRDAYLSVRDNYPSVVTVFNVLPGPNCEEYEWMRKFAIEFGVVRQGIQKENVLTQFQATGAPVDQIFANVLSWVEKSIGEMDDVLGQTSITSSETATEFARETDVLIQGFPDKLTQYEVAGIFSKFRVKDLRLGLDARSAYVRLGSKFEAMQAAEILDNSMFNELYRLSVEPCHHMIREEMKREMTKGL